MTPKARILKEKRALVWPLVLALLANIALFALVVYPLSRKVADGQREADASAAALGQARRSHAAARATVAGKGQADEELQRFYGDVLPPDLSAARRITYLPISQLAEESNLRVERRISDWTPIRESSLARFTQTTILTGQYSDIRRFIYALETRPEFVVVENLDLSQNENEASRGITVTLQIATYFRTGDDGD